MKSILFLLSFSIISNIAISRNLVAVIDGGNWTDPATWGGFVPAPGDNITIPAGITVKITTEIEFDENDNPITINIDGTLDFVDEAELKLPCESTVIISETGEIVPLIVEEDEAEGELEICDEEEWKAEDGTLKGPTILGKIPLPVELTSFLGFVEENAVKLEWSTASEINNDYFQVEKSTNGVDFETLTVVSGNGNSNTNIDYSTYDEIPANNSTMYYRLKQVDYDGEFEYSNILSVNLENTIEFSDCKFKIMPNPCISKCIVKLTECAAVENKDFTFYIYDAIGNTVLASSPQIVSNGEARFSFDSGNKLKPGMYIVRGKAKNKLVEDKMIINK